VENDAADEDNADGDGEEDDCVGSNIVHQTFRQDSVDRYDQTGGA